MGKSPAFAGLSPPKLFAQASWPYENRGALIDVYCDGELRGSIVFSPYTIRLEGLSDGKHRIGLKLYGTRVNGFGPVHHDRCVYFYQDPNCWRSENQHWLYEYQLYDFGILKTPEIR